MNLHYYTHYKKHSALKTQLNDTQHYDAQYNATQHYETEHNDIHNNKIKICNTDHDTMKMRFLQSVSTTECNDKCRHADFFLTYKWSK
jgi:hypothetical protein